MISPFAYISAGAAIAAAFCFWQWQNAEEEITTLKVNQVQLENSVNTLNSTIEELKIQRRNLSNDIKELQSAESAAMSDFNTVTVELNQLRTKEAYNALQKPFERGVVAADMLHQRLSAITRAPDRN